MILSAAFLAPIFTGIPSAEAAACAVTSGTVSGTTRYAIFNSGSACTWSVPTGVTSISYLTVGGGGGGGGARQAASSPNLGGGGGGAGGIVLSSTFSTTGGTSITITVGTGGAGGAAGAAGANGGASSFTYSATTITSNGGGAGAGSNDVSGPTTLSGDGGSNSSFAGGANDWDGGGGGAGAGANGSAGIDIGGQGGTGGAGGAGVTNNILGSTTYFGGGGGGGGTPSGNSSEFDGLGGTGGSNVGGNGGGGAGVQPTAGATNTGSGGGGGGWRYTSSDSLRAGAAGASGKIVFVYTKSGATISSLSITSSSGADSTYSIGNVITVTVSTSEAVTVTVFPLIPIVGLVSKNFIYASGSGGSTLLFNYTVVSGDSSTAGLAITANTLALNSGTMLDTGGLALTLTHSAVTASGSHKVDGIVPTITSTSSMSIQENTSVVQTLVASETGTFTITGGSDSAFFTLNASTGVMTISPRDFENAADSDLNNVYYVSARFTDAAGNATENYNYFITITNVAEVANIGTPSLSGTAKKGIAVTITVTADVAGKFTFISNGKRIAKCINKATTGSSPNFSGQCTWTPTTRTLNSIYAIFVPTSSQTAGGNSARISVLPTTRGTTR
jgi:hypothetical protein